MLKSQDCIILLKILANPSENWSQRELATTLYISLSEVNAGIKRLEKAHLLRKDKHGSLLPNIDAVIEFLIFAVKFIFPGQLGEYTRGIPTSIAAPIFQDLLAIGNDPIPVWPDVLGSHRGVALDPIHPSIPKSLQNNPDNIFYEYLVLVDTIRSGRVRERNLAIKILKERLKNEK